jgi:hypothetical protein
MLLWHLLQYVLNRAAPSVGTTGGVVLAKAVVIAWISAALRDDKEPMPPGLPLMALCIRAAVVPSLEEVASRVKKGKRR